MQLYCHRSGQGPPLVLLHGLLGSSTNWLGLSREFATRHTVLAVDLRNHGRSPHATEMSYALMADDLAELLDVSGIGAAHVLGHSMGGKVAMQFALSNPARVKRLIVVDIAPRALPPQHDAVIAALLAVDPSICRSRAEVDAALAPQLPDVSLRRFLLKNLTASPSGVLRWQLNLRGIQTHDERLREAVAGGRPFAGPALFVRGEHSNYITEADRQEIARLFPKAQLQTVPGAGHWVHADAPVPFVKLVGGFLNGSLETPRP